MRPLVRSARSHRPHVELAPAAVDVPTGAAAGVFTTLDWTATGTPRKVSNREAHLAPYELLVHREPGDELTVTASIDSLPDVRRATHRPRFEERLLESLDYCEQTARPEVTEADLPLVTDAGSRVFSLVPAGDAPLVDGEHPAFEPGVALLGLITLLDRIASEWLIQVTLASHRDVLLPRDVETATGTVELEYVLGLSVVLPARAFEPTETGPAPATVLVEIDEHRPALGLVALAGDEGARNAVATATMRVTDAFPATEGYCRGFCVPPGRAALLTHGIGGSVSPLERCPRDGLRELADPARPLGFDTPPASEAAGTRAFPLGLPAGPASCTYVEHPATLADRVPRQLPDAIDAPGPTFVLATDRELLERCAAVADIVCRENGDYRPRRDLGHYTADAFGGYLSDDAVGGLAGWVDDLVGSDRPVILFDLGGFDDPGAAAGRLVGALSNAGYRAQTDGATPTPTRVADVFVAVPELVTASNHVRETVAIAASHTGATGLTLSLHAPYPDADDESAGLSTLAEAADVVLADNAGPSSSVIPDAKLTPARSSWAATIDQQGSERVWNTYVSPARGSVSPFVLPLLKLHTAGYNDDYLDASVGLGRRDALEQVLRRPATEPKPVTRTVAPPGGSLLDIVSARGGSAHFHPRRTGLPDGVTYNDERDCYECHACVSDPDDQPHRRDADLDGLRIIIECCHSLADEDRSVLRRFREPQLKLTEEEIADSELRIEQLRLLKAIYLVTTDAADDFFEFHPVFDSGRLLMEDFGLDADDIEQLEAAGYISTDTQPHLIFSLTQRGRKAIKEPWKATYEFGNFVGELNESGQHDMMGRAIYRFFEVKFGDRPGLRVDRYVPIEVPTDDGGSTTMSIDVAVRDADGAFVACGAADRENNDRSKSNLDSYRKFCAADPEEALFVVPGYDEVAGLFEDLFEAGQRGDIEYDGPLYGKNTRRADYDDIDQPGMTDVMTIRTLVEQLDPPWT